MDEKLVNEAISRWLEPVPEWTHYDYANHLSTLSDGGCWIRDGGLFALNWLCDEAANARLLEAMPCPQLFRDAGGWCCRGELDQWSFNNDDRKTSVWLAFCKFAKIEISEIEIDPEIEELEKR